MRYLKKYENHEDIHRICQEYGIRNYTINSDGSIDVSGSLDLKIGLEELPLKFNNVSGIFYCTDNDLTSLVGCPKSVGYDFECSQNSLTNLVGCPKSVGRDFSCEWNSIETFEGLDFTHIGGAFYCIGNPIWSVWQLFMPDHTKFEFFNDCDIIREDLVIILDRLNFFLDYIDIPTVNGVRGYKCI